MGVRGSAKRRRRAPCSSAADDGNVLEHESKRQGAPTPSAATAGANDDLISGLPDDVLLHILKLLHDAREAACTGVLSRRWRGLWTRLAALRFDSRSSWPKFSSLPNGSQMFIAMVNDALARHAAANTEPAIQHLDILFKMRRLLPLCFQAAQGWIRNAVRSEVKSFVLDLLYWPSYEDDDTGNKREQRFVVALEDLPSSSKMETMRLALDNATVRLPVAATFAALVDLSLENMEFARGNGQLLNRLLSSACCPRLRKLSLREIIIGLDELLLIESQTLLELSMEDLYDKYVISLRTPSLRVLRVNYCSLDVLKISAPRLEEIRIFDASTPSYRIDIDGELPCVRSLKVELSTHALFHDVHEGDDDEDTNDAGIRLLNCCTSAASLEVDLHTTQV
ncbi:unnamed protein product [Urochloa humidicola]